MKPDLFAFFCGPPSSLTRYCSPRIFGKAPPALAAGPRRCGLYTPAAAAGLTKARHWSSLIRQVLELRGLIPNWWRSPAAVPTQRGVRVRASVPRCVDRCEQVAGRGSRHWPGTRADAGLCVRVRAGQAWPRSEECGGHAARSARARACRGGGAHARTRRRRA